MSADGQRAYSEQMPPQTTLPKYRTTWMTGILTLALCCTTAQGASLFGDHSCPQWHELDFNAKRTWANAFLAPLSLTFKGLRKSKVDKYNDDPKAPEAAIQSIDAFCWSHPDLGAADAAGRYLRNLFEMSPQ